MNLTKLTHWKFVFLIPALDFAGVEGKLLFLYLMTFSWTIFGSEGIRADNLFLPKAFSGFVSGRCPVCFPLTSFRWVLSTSLTYCYPGAESPITVHVFTANHITAWPIATLPIDQSNRSSGFFHFWLNWLNIDPLTLKMASAQVVETSVANNSPSQDSSSHPNDHFQYSRFPFWFLNLLMWVSPRTGGSVGWARVCPAGGREFDSGRTNTQGLKITEEKVVPL